MSRTPPCLDQRESALINLIREKTAGMVAAVRAGQPQTTKLVTDLLGEFITDDNAVAQLVRESLAGTNSLQGVITDLIWTEAEALAQRELAERERRNLEPTLEERCQRYLDSIAA